MALKRKACVMADCLLNCVESLAVSYPQGLLAEQIGGLMRQTWQSLENHSQCSDHSLGKCFDQSFGLAFIKALLVKYYERQIDINDMLCLMVRSILN